MARHNEILTGRHNRFLQKLFSMKGPPPAPQLTSEITPVHHILTGAENRYIESWNRFAVGAVTAQVAAQNSAVRLRNPAGSNAIGVIERLSFSEGAGDTVLVVQNTNGVALATAIGQRCLDNRPVAGSSSTLGATLQTSIGNNIAVVGGVVARCFIAPNPDYIFIVTENQEITLLPGDDLTLYTTAVNVFLTANFMWRERFLEDSERT